MIKTKFVFMVSMVAMMAVNSALASAPASNESVGTAHTVYTDQGPTEGAGIAGVSYVNKAVNKAGASAQAAEAHAAAAGQSALSAASSASAAAASAKTANEALATKADKSELEDYATTSYVDGKLEAVNTSNNTLKGRVDTLEATAGALDDDKQDKSTAAYQMGNASGGWTTMTAAQQSALNSGVTSTTVSQVATNTTNIGKKQATLTATGNASRPVYATAGGVAAVTGISIPVGTATATSTTEWAAIWVE